jgi:hypothetical protein
MIPKVEWPHSGFELRSPFDRGKNERLIKLTFDSRSLQNIDGVEADALAILYELSHLDIVSALVFDGNEFPRILLREKDRQIDYSSITIVGPDKEVLSWNAGINLSNIDDDSVIRIIGTEPTISLDGESSEGVRDRQKRIGRGTK